MSNYPPGTSSSDFDSDHRTYTLTLDDVLSKGPISVRGIDFDTHATVNFIKNGEDGSVEVTDLEIRSVLIVVQGDESPQTFVLDWESFSSSPFKKDLETAIETLAL